VACLSIKTFGTLHASLDCQTPVDLRYDKVWALLVWLAVEQAHPQRREYVAALFWPEQPDRMAAQSH
jgi:DNA-binding SARP family transcriptional activator